MRLAVILGTIGLLGLVGCAPPAPPAAASAPPVDAGTIQLLNQYAQTVDALQGLVDAQIRLRDNTVIARRLELDVAVRGRLHEAQAAGRRVEELSGQVLATATSDAERGKIALVLSELGRGQGDRSGSTLPQATRDSAAFRSLTEALAIRDALSREITVLEAQIAVLDGVLANPATQPAVPASVPSTRSIDSRL
ncbi:MAG: hypothetical protein HOV80_00150 [Polyangiaceae bacterium]|nr:hypothetical protein [Polyangiaceae bacterium]